MAKKKISTSLKFVSMRLPKDVVDQLDAYTRRLSMKVGIPISRTQGLVHLVRTHAGKARAR